ncbi:MAG: hypothetical protein WC816_04260 [Sphingomonas sp.]|jgi:hypothetical protein
MIGSSKPLASLSSGLLARKGQARPAMRPHGFTGFGSMTEAMDDLGWNDMGPNAGPVEPMTPAPVPLPTPAPVLPMTPVFEDLPHLDEDVLPAVLRDRAALQDEFTVNAALVSVPEPAPVIEQLARRKRPRSVAVKAPVSAPVTIETVKSVAGNKAAFTLRLDEDRHLRLRLASALKRQSAQQLVTAALDALLAAMPEVEALAQRSPRQGKTQG